MDVLAFQNSLFLYHTLLFCLAYLLEAVDEKLQGLLDCSFLSFLKFVVLHFEFSFFNVSFLRRRKWNSFWTVSFYTVKGFKYTRCDLILCINQPTYLLVVTVYVNYASKKYILFSM